MSNSIVDGAYKPTSRIQMYEGRMVQVNYSHFCDLKYGYQKLTYLLTPWSRLLLEKLTVLQLVKKFLPFYGTRRFITAFTSARHLFLSRAS